MLNRSYSLNLDSTILIDVTLFDEATGEALDGATVTGKLYSPSGQELGSPASVIPLVDTAGSYRLTLAASIVTGSVGGGYEFRGTATVGDVVRTFRIALVGIYGLK